MTKLKLLSKEDLPKLYQEHFVNDFAHADVLRPYQRMVELIDCGKYIGLMLYNAQDPLAYVFAAKVEDVLFVDFFAVLNGLRGGGIGSEMLSQIKNKYPNCSIVVEVEDIAFSVSDGDRIIREKRVHFYQKNGFCTEDIAVSLFGDRYKIMVAGQQAEKDKRVAMLSGLYDELYTKEVARKNISIL